MSGLGIDLTDEQIAAKADALQHELFGHRRLEMIAVSLDDRTFAEVDFRSSPPVVTRHEWGERA